MKVKVEITEKELRELVWERLRELLGAAADNVIATDVAIQVKSKQNYRSEWEEAAFRAVVEVDR